MKYVIAFLVLSVIIIVHEFGHFVVAKASGVTVTEFSLGMGPRLLKFKRKGTMYSLKLFLFGGSCRMLGEDEDDSSDGSFNNKSVWKRIAIVAAGPIFNFIFAFIMAIILIGKLGYDPCIVYDVDKNGAAAESGLQSGDKITEINGHNITFYGDYTIYSMQYGDEYMHITYERDGKEYTTEFAPEYIDYVYQMGVLLNATTPSINEVYEGTPAHRAGLEAGDLILSINGNEVSETDDVSPNVQASEGKMITLVADRDGEKITFKLTPDSVKSDSYDPGFYVTTQYVKCNPIQTIGYSFKEVGYWIKAVFSSFKLIFTGKVSVNEVSGPVGIVSAIGNIVEESKSDGALYVFLNIVNWCIMINANLGVMNLLPIPALDGGRLVFLIIEAVRRKPVAREKEGMVHFVGIILLMVLMVAIMFNDIRKLF